MTWSHWTPSGNNAEHPNLKPQHNRNDNNADADNSFPPLPLPAWPPWQPHQQSSLSGGKRRPEYEALDPPVTKTTRLHEPYNPSGHYEPSAGSSVNPLPPYVPHPFDTNDLNDYHPQSTFPSTAEHFGFFPPHNDERTENSSHQCCADVACLSTTCEASQGCDSADECDDPHCEEEDCYGEQCSSGSVCHEESCAQTNCPGESCTEYEHCNLDLNGFNADDPSTWGASSQSHGHSDATQGHYTPQLGDSDFDCNLGCGFVAPHMLQNHLSQAHGAFFNNDGVYKTDGFYWNGSTNEGRCNVGPCNTQSNDLKTLLQHSCNANTVHNTSTLQPTSKTSGPIVVGHTPTPTPSLGYSDETSAPSENIGETGALVCQWVIDDTAPDKPNICKHGFNSHRDLHHHIKSDHIKPMIKRDGFRCRWHGCPRNERGKLPFEQKGKLERHIMSHSKHKPYDCPFGTCNKSFPTQQALDNHVNIHTGDRPYKCDHPECGKRFKQATQLSCHKRTHTNEKPFKCEICGKECSESSNFNKHKKTHDKIYVCEEEACGEVFSRFERLERHWKTRSHCLRMLIDETARQGYKKRMEDAQKERELAKMKERSIGIKPGQDADSNGSVSGTGDDDCTLTG